MYPCTHAGIHTRVHAHVHTHVRMYTHTHTHTHVHTPVVRHVSSSTSPPFSHQAAECGWRARLKPFSPPPPFSRQTAKCGWCARLKPFSSPLPPPFSRQTAKCALARECLELMERKQTNLSVAADVDTAEEMLSLADQVCGVRGSAREGGRWAGVAAERDQGWGRRSGVGCRGGGKLFSRWPASRGYGVFLCWKGLSRLRQLETYWIGVRPLPCLLSTLFLCLKLVRTLNTN
eukprot:353833-Chlamydomonas_euryale.AAC.3